MKNLMILTGMLIVVLGLTTSAVAKIDPPTCTGCGIQLVLLRSPAIAHVGETVTYWISAEVGNFPPCCAISDVQLSWVAPDGTSETLIGPPGIHLNPSEKTTEFTRNYVVAEGDIRPDGTIIAYGEATGMVNDSPDANTPSTDNDEILATILSPCVEVTKEVDCDISKEGDDVIYHICIRNCNPDTALKNVTVVDDELGDLSGLFPDELTDGEWVCIDYSYTIQPDDSDPLVNTVTVSAEDTTGFAVTDTATETVDLIHPGLEVSKECQTFPVAPGGDADFLVTITNTGDADLEISTNDPEIPDFTLPTTDPVFTQIVTETHTGGDEVCNEIEVTWTLDPDQYCSMDNTDTITSGDCCPVSKPCVNVEKNVEPEVSKIGDVVVYTITVCNCSETETDLMRVSVIDTVLGDISGSFADTLPYDECETHSFNYTIKDTDPDPLENVVTVVYEDETGFDVNDTDFALVDLVEVCINITKDVEPTVAEVNEEVLYTICIHNCGQWPLEHVVVEDPLLSGILPFPTELDIDEMVCLVFPYVIQADDPNPLENCSTVESDPAGPMENPVNDRDCARVEIPPPSEGRWTGGGTIAWEATIPEGAHVTHGFEFHCDLRNPNRLEVNWTGGHRWHMMELLAAECIMNPDLPPPDPPEAPVNEVYAVGEGRYDKEGRGYLAYFYFTDTGEPGGLNDFARITIIAPDGIIVLQAEGTLQKGNHQAHRDNK